jgi:hypothetical protein
MFEFILAAFAMFFLAFYAIPRLMERIRIREAERRREREQQEARDARRAAWLSKYDRDAEEAKARAESERRRRAAEKAARDAEWLDAAAPDIHKRFNPPRPPAPAPMPSRRAVTPARPASQSERRPDTFNNNDGFLTGVVVGSLLTPSQMREQYKAPGEHLEPGGGTFGGGGASGAWASTGPGRDPYVDVARAIADPAPAAESSVSGYASASADASSSYDSGSSSSSYDSGSSGGDSGGGGSGGE